MYSKRAAGGIEDRRTKSLLTVTATSLGLDALA